MISIRSYLVTLALSISFSGNAQDEPSPIRDKGYAFLRYENDYFNAQDWYFTQGTRFELAAMFMQKSPVSKLLFSQSTETFRSDALFIQHDAYTPTSISSDTILTGDHPFGCAFYVGEKRLSINSNANSRLSSDIIVGALGMAGACKDVQTVIHEATGNPIPVGWQFQVANDLILNYHVRYEKGFLRKPGAELLAFGDGRIGTIYDDARLGLSGRMGKMRSFFEPIRKTGESRFRFYFQGSAYVEVVGFNATMQGGLFSDSEYTIPSSDINRVLYGASARVVLAFGRWSIEHYKTWRTAAFRDGRNHGWGAGEIRFLF